MAMAYVAFKRLVKRLAGLWLLRSFCEQAKEKGQSCSNKQWRWRECSNREVEAGRRHVIRLLLTRSSRLHTPLFTYYRTPLRFAIPQWNDHMLPNAIFLWRHYSPVSTKQWTTILLCFHIPLDTCSPIFIGSMPMCYHLQTFWYREFWVF